MSYTIYHLHVGGGYLSSGLSKYEDNRLFRLLVGNFYLLNFAYIIYIIEKGLMRYLRLKSRKKMILLTNTREMSHPNLLAFDS